MFCTWSGSFGHFYANLLWGGDRWYSNPPCVKRNCQGAMAAHPLPSRTHTARRRTRTRNGPGRTGERTATAQGVGQRGSGGEGRRCGGGGGGRAVGEVQVEGWGLGRPPPDPGRTHPSPPASWGGFPFGPGWGGRRGPPRRRPGSRGAGARAPARLGERRETPLWHMQEALLIAICMPLEHICMTHYTKKVQET